MHTEAVSIHVWERLQKLHTFQLVFHLFHTQLAEGGLFEIETTMLTASIVETEHHVAVLCHPNVPTTHTPMTRSINVVSMRTTIDIHNGWIFLRRVEIGWKHEAIVEVGYSIGSLDGSPFHFWHGELSPRLLDVIVLVAQGTICCDDFVTACNLWR